ncbi:hypothetical protein B0T24DRAFT_592973 [Lasiosphaeria ovina]|uniref:Uncharacterized protein n=1 Tax=Lasiosphaeria ovina TaxID=92902 RepID=A0AAE0KIL9_9PEZI|nr:hypothetical protein B0T24DRAFT_592973 [Lasiosphaeria ovina]
MEAKAAFLVVDERVAEEMVDALGPHPRVAEWPPYEVEQLPRGDVIWGRVGTREAPLRRRLLEQVKVGPEYLAEGLPNHVGLGAEGRVRLYHAGYQDLVLVPLGVNHLKQQFLILHMEQDAAGHCLTEPRSVSNSKQNLDEWRADSSPSLRQAVSSLRTAVGISASPKRRTRRRKSSKTAPSNATYLGIRRRKGIIPGQKQPPQRRALQIFVLARHEHIDGAQVRKSQAQPSPASAASQTLMATRQRQTRFISPHSAASAVVGRRSPNSPKLRDRPRPLST